MESVLVLIGLFVLLIGVGSLFYPRLVGLINLPFGNRSTKSITSIVIGIIIILIGLFIG